MAPQLSWICLARSCPLLHMTLTAKIYIAEKDPISPDFGYSYSRGQKYLHTLFCYK
jgi:hypothetical protein